MLEVTGCSIGPACPFISHPILMSFGVLYCYNLAIVQPITCEGARFLPRYCHCLFCDVCIFGAWVFAPFSTDVPFTPNRTKQPTTFLLGDFPRPKSRTAGIKAMVTSINEHITRSPLVQAALTSTPAF
ncbi:hypothetical protein F5B22DRAFT_479837 [Xylaria bambusicola]|uniref:uncharacterized protein n=1 Tax=Xylaria bambusicola TaxID=326684 RepID=UPI0020080E60|nr:uncharacterized protein F5B22DRAFT_479837 [Xylaria bambusicola]KAI0506129.1 hypothetical protein F5B22DRAFT_479837 [Xylaria bambusicola]